MHPPKSIKTFILVLALFSLISCNEKNHKNVKDIELPTFMPLEDALSLCKCQFLLNGANEIYFNNEPIDQNTMCINLIKGNCFEKPILFRNKKGTKYEGYISCYKEIQKCIEEKREAVAYSLFLKPFTELNQNEKQEMKLNWSFEIIETKPE